MVDWSELPRDLVMAIEEQLFFYEDKIRFRCVCSAWQSVLPQMPHQKLNLLPWLLVPLKSKTEIGSGSSFGFFDPLEKKLHCLQLSDSDPGGKGMLFRGSSHGWVVNIEENDSIHVINPLTGARVHLPPRSKFPDVVYYRPDEVGEEYGFGDDYDFFSRSKAETRVHLTEKILLSASPQSDQDFVAVAVYGEYGKLAYCKRGDKKWRLLDEEEINYIDFMFHKEVLYAVTIYGSVKVCDIHSPFPKMKEFVPKPRKPICISRFYLVQSSDGLILVQRHDTSLKQVEGSDPESMAFLYDTIGFTVFKLDTFRNEWYEIQSIGEDMLFLGWNSTLSLSSNNFPGYVGNCIYFTDENTLGYREEIIGGFEIGIFNLTHGTIQHLPGYNTIDSELLLWPPPIWFMPNLI